MQKVRSPDDFVVWPDGSCATLEDVENGEYNWKSDDFEIVSVDDEARLTELGLAEELGLG